ncbi:uncharacterized protein [Palaemon carinicauda]|uniref:uncharacterized protein n=1 Tax=Palaemon carinicauda TaxID=392227 RepID=UPI0035B68181
MRDTRSRAVPAPALTHSPTRPRVATAQRVAQEAPKLAHGRSRLPLGSPSIPHKLATDTIVHDAPVSRPVSATRPVPVFKTTKVAQRPPERPHAACPTQPPQQRTPVRPHPDARHARPRSPARPQASVPVLSDQHQPSCPQVARDPAPALTRPQPVLPDTRSGAPVISRPSGPRQVAARPRIRPPPAPAPAPDHRTPTPSLMRSRGHVPAPAVARPHACAVASAPSLLNTHPRAIAPLRPPP